MTFSKPMFWSFCILELSRVIKWETISIALEPSLNKWKEHYMCCCSFLLSIKTEDLLKDIQNSEYFLWIYSVNWKSKPTFKQNEKSLVKKEESFLVDCVDKFYLSRTISCSIQISENKKNYSKLFLENIRRWYWNIGL